MIFCPGTEPAGHGPPRVLAVAAGIRQHKVYTLCKCVCVHSACVCVYERVHVHVSEYVYVPPLEECPLCQG